MSSAQQSESLLRFFDPTAKGIDPRGRTLSDILSWPDQHLEYSHDYIQNVFPLPEGSLFNSAIWLVTPEVYEAFRQRPELQASCETSFDRICKFYGLNLISGDSESPNTVRVERGQNFDQAKQRWVSRFNHNHLRITRILRSLRVLGLVEHASALHHFLISDAEVKRKVSTTSIMYWTRAVERPLRLPPDEDDDTATGIEWLKDVEQ